MIGINVRLSAVVLSHNTGRSHFTPRSDSWKMSCKSKLWQSST